MNARTLVFYDDALPFSGLRPPASVIDAWRQTGQVVGADQLMSVLRTGTFNTLLWLHGSYFPAEAWPDLVPFLRTGKGLIVVGGAPFCRPLRRQGNDWIQDPVGPAHLQELGVHEVIPIADDHQVETFTAFREIPLLTGLEAAFSSRDGDHYVLQGSPGPDHPHESGSAGPMDVETFRLLEGRDRYGRIRIAPVVLLEHKRGAYAGGRWIFSHRLLDRAFWHNGGERGLQILADFAARGAVDLGIAPSYASYYLHESPTLTLTAEALRPGDVKRRWSVSATIVRADAPDQILWSYQDTVDMGADRHTTQVPVDLSLQPGLYHIEARFSEGEAAEEVRLVHQGFWGYDPDLLRSQARLTAGRDYFRKQDQPFPIVGTTYMAGDVARKFLFQPNAYVLDQDMALIHDHSLNYIRTGLWTAWRHAMFIDGRPSETVLRALDAFLLSANRHSLEVTFTFFSFTPESWEGENPYLDPRSIAAQKRLIAAIVERHRDTTNVEWDLINEPSLFNPEKIFRGPQSQRDRFEIQAYRTWLEARHTAIETLRARWAMSATALPDFSAIDPPDPGQMPFDLEDVTADKNGLPWLDYALFTMDMFNRWAADLAGTIRRITPDALVTVGQDEALGAQRPSPFFYQAAVDYTTVHTWWLMDQLAWDGIFAKTLAKPNLVQETGIMYVETATGRAKRSEEELAHLLERKFAYAFATRAAGAVQWIWNTNPYMHNLNESNIGALRADGTEKPEARVLEGLARFIDSIRDWFEDRPPEAVCVVYPYSNDLSHRRLAVEATTRLTRVLTHDMKIPFRAVGEYDLTSLQEHTPRLVMVPSPHNFSRAARQYLFDLARHRPLTIFWTGPVNLDEYWNEYDSGIALAETPSNLHRDEILAVDHRPIFFSFDYRASMVGLHGQRAASGPSTAIHATPLGQGDLLWCPLPIELSSNLEGLAQVYRYALESAQITDGMDWQVEPFETAVFCRRMEFPGKGSLYLFISEAAYPSTVIAYQRAERRRYRITVPPLRTVLMAVGPRGRIRAVYGPPGSNAERL